MSGAADPSDDTGTRQWLAAILAADAEGYSRLMSADDRATISALDAARAVFRAQIESNHGRVIDMAGDSVLAVFEAATGAVSAALAVQRDLQAVAATAPEDRCMRFRIGVHLGDVIEKADGTVYGDGVNIAARLQGLAEPGGISVSGSVHLAVLGKLAADFEDQGEQVVKNIALPVHVYRARAHDGAPTPAEAGPTPAPGAGDVDQPPSGKPTIAVLPFTNMSGDPGQECFTDGITEDIITELSRFHSLSVMARNSSFAYKGQSPDLRLVGQELGVRYVVEGSFRRADDQIRVTAQLIDASTGMHLWVEKYDRAFEAIFALQAEVTRSIVTAIVPQIAAVELEKVRRRRPEDLGAYEKAVHARASLWHASMQSDSVLRDQALQEARDALAIDARNTLALCVLAQAQRQRVYFHTTPDPEADWNEGMAAAVKAIEIDPSDSQSHACKGALLGVAPNEDRLDEALVFLHTAHELNPHDTAVLSVLGWTEAMAGNAQAGIDLLRHALGVNPHDPQHHVIQVNLAWAHMVGDNHEEAIDCALGVIRKFPDSPVVYLVLAASHAARGQNDLANAALEKARVLMPALVQSGLDGKPGVGVTAQQLRYTSLLRAAAGLGC